MADAIVTDVVQEVLKILTASDVVVEEFAYGPNMEVYTRYGQRCKADCSEGRLEEPLVDGDVDREWSLSGGDDLKELVSTVVESTNVEDGTREDIILRLKYHQCKADSSEGQLEEPLVDGDVEREWSLSGGDHLKELVSTVLESTNVKDIYGFSDCRSYTHDVIEQFLQGLCTNHTIVSASFHILCPRNRTIVVDKSVVMLRHNIGLKSFSLRLLSDIKGTTKHSGFGNALEMNHTLQILQLIFPSGGLDLEELVQPLIMDENGHQANSTLTSLIIYPSRDRLTEVSTMSPIGATLARMLRKNSSIKHLELPMSLTRESDVQELIQSLVENHSLENLNLSGCDGVTGSVFPAIMDVLLVNFTLKDINLFGTPLYPEGKAIKEQLRKNEMYKKLHLKELEMAEPTSARVIFCGFPYAGMS
jgi:hypothetical protein